MDVRIINAGSLIGFQPLSEAAEAWMAEHLPDDAPTLGNTVYAEHRYADPIIDGMIADGLEVE